MKAPCCIRFKYVTVKVPIKPQSRIGLTQLYPIVQITLHLSFLDHALASTYLSVENPSPVVVSTVFESSTNWLAFTCVVSRNLSWRLTFGVSSSGFERELCMRWKGRLLWRDTHSVGCCIHIFLNADDGTSLVKQPQPMTWMR